MIARIFPLEAKRSAFNSGIPLERAATKATSELKGNIVAAKKADRKRVSSAMLSAY
ncbi:hypothetical protein [Sulfurimonas crateris]|uniref:hypothetical protein n=1 Tax=Sulfurimonas crateris TaxID=2574727 RepID=UPI0014769D8C|nr:hypothetical protein [Sulfurimonas crateris]